jgi:hypothetical protein
VPPALLPVHSRRRIRVGKIGRDGRDPFSRSVGAQRKDVPPSDVQEVLGYGGAGDADRSDDEGHTGQICWGR